MHAFCTLRTRPPPLCASFLKLAAIAAHANEVKAALVDGIDTKHEHRRRSVYKYPCVEPAPQWKLEPGMAWSPPNTSRSPRSHHIFSPRESYVPFVSPASSGAPIPPRSLSLNCNTSACRRLIRFASAPHERIPLIEAILSSQDEEEVIRGLPLQDAQVFIDAINEARFPSHRHRRSRD